MSLSLVCNLEWYFHRISIKGIFSSLTGKTALTILKDYTSLDRILDEEPQVLITKISQASRIGVITAREKYNQLIQVARDANSFAVSVDSNFFLITEFISFIEFYDLKIEKILKTMHSLALTHIEETFVKQVRLLESIKGVGFLSALSLICEIGDFNAFTKPKQLFG